MAKACGVSFELLLDLAAAAQFRRELAQVRRTADANCLGGDFRIDYGDPTLGLIEDARGRFLFAGLAAGRRFAGGEVSSPGARARPGFRYPKLDSADDAEYRAEKGLGFEVSRTVADGELSVSDAVVFRYGNAPADLTEQLQTDFTMIRESIVLPAAAGNSIGLLLTTIQAQETRQQHPITSIAIGGLQCPPMP